MDCGLRVFDRVVWGFAICMLASLFMRTQNVESMQSLSVNLQFTKLQLQVSNFPLCLPGNFAASFSISFKLYSCLTLNDEDWEWIDFTDAGDEKKVGFSVLRC